MKSTMTKVLIAASLLMGFGCASSAHKEEVREVNKEVREQAPADTPEQIAARAGETFANAEGLNADQKTRLALVYKNVYLESMKIRREIGQSKSALFSTLAKPNYKDSEVAILKKKIVGLDQQRLNIMFDALTEVQKIVGKGKNLEKIYKHFEDNEIPHRMIKDYNY